MSRPQSLKPKSAVAAIDFGTTNTGYGYYMRANKGPVSSRDIVMEQQVSTTLLLSPQKKFVAFGDAAEDAYKKLTLKNEHRDHYYFRHFKMDLHHKPLLTHDMKIVDASGKSMVAMTVFELSIKHVKKKVLERMELNMGDKIIESDVMWVLTVPAIWRDSAKQFMREAAVNAGISNAQLTLALEPESAAICCKEMALRKTEGIEGIMLKAFDPGQKYIVLDCGGGTVDTTGHEVQENGQLKELHAATGGPWGGKLVNDAFEEFISELVGADVLKKFKAEKATNWIDLERDFEQKKRSFDGSGEVDLLFPHALKAMYEKVKGETLEERLQKSPYARKCELLESDILLKSELVITLFNKATDRINKHIEELMLYKKLKNISTILLVGGFSDSKVVVSAVKTHFRDQLKVIAPPNGGSAIMKGAVMFGCDPNVIAVRISPFTYGVHTRMSYDKNRHGRKIPKDVNGRKVVDNVFHKHLEIETLVMVGNKSTPKNYVVTNRFKPDVMWKVFKSTDKDPVFCDDPNCSYVGKLAISIPETVKETKVSIQVSLTCRGTELEAEAYLPEHKGINCSIRLDFLDTLQAGCDMSDTIVVG
ncbi:heat shock 70 kDa protein 12A-like isoform X2 [Mya arenaria]|nr:heat shock 70 kDa protein 12A-like isoform X2 [Mya arenaria]XP_052761149.1 heat shock 70 kDa protein 12A-like isoform X2 [Mya arenaria]XP_052761150.1 heat shock 70 kDa protein 12A-like isoform X2 [Mya arenaria]